MLALARPPVNEVWPLAANQNHRFNRPANDNNITSGLCTRTKYAYDANGNTTSGDGIKTYKWDAENRLIEVDYVGGTNKTVFTYDAFSHRITTAETVGGVTTTTRNLWCGDRICQTRTSADVVTARIHPEGEYIVTGTKKYVYMPDQLGSVRDIVDATTGTTVGAIDDSPYGKPTRTWGTVTPLYQYAGTAYHANSGINLATYRAVDGVTGRWLNRDPIRESGGINLYSYAGANPINLLDPSGLQSVSPFPVRPGIPIPPIAIPGTPENDQWVHWATDNITNPVSDFVRNNCPDCVYLQGKIKEASNEIRELHRQMLVDPLDLYNKAYCVKNLGERKGSYVGHYERLENMQAHLLKLITQADQLKCPVDPNDRALLELEIPTCPLVY